MEFLQKYIQDIQLLCRSYNVKELYAFGSVTGNEFNADSDIDLLVKFKPINVLDYSDNYFNFKFSLEGLLKKPIDLLEEPAIKNPYLKRNIKNQRQLIYGY